MSALIDAHDAALFDLDGVLYVGPAAVEDAPGTVQELQRRGVLTAFVTNNASRSPHTVSTHLTELGMPAREQEIVTSAQAIARLIADHEQPGTRVLVVGTPALATEIAKMGLRPVESTDDDPQAVVQGYDPSWTVARLQDACVALHRGLPWYASNDDLTIPTDRGIMPGMGSWISLLSTACDGRRPDAIAGKPHLPLLEETLARTEARHPIFVGDRLDTDIEGANAIGMTSLFVTNTGAHGKADLIAAEPQRRPTHVGASVAALLQPARVVHEDDGMARVGEQIVILDGTTLTWQTEPVGMESQWDALWALAHLAWRHPDADASNALTSLSAIN